MDNFLTITPLVIAFIGIVYFARKKMQKLGVIYVILFYIKWFLGIVVTMGAFYMIMVSGEWFKAQDYSVVFSLPLGVAVWFIPMHYISKYFGMLETKYKKESNEE